MFVTFLFISSLKPLLLPLQAGSLTRKGARLDILLLVHALANFASWLVGLACEATGMDGWLSPTKTRRKLYSTVRIGREALVRS